MNAASVEELLNRALLARTDFLTQSENEGRHDTAFRLFNGFVEGFPDLVVDLYARTLVLVNYAQQPHEGLAVLAVAQQFFLQRLPWLHSVIVKTRHSVDNVERRGVLVYGTSPDRKVREHGIWYAVDLMLNLDASLYLDTRNLRSWAISKLAGMRVLNTFAYTGSLGVAALAGGARQVIQMDLNRRFLNLAKDSFTLNGFPIRRADFLSGDFWALTSRLNRAGALFDCVFVDPPFFSLTERGRVDLVEHSSRVINKVRPLVAHNGWLVAINNALFVSGEQFHAQLEALCDGGYLSIEELIPVPPDFTGYPKTRVGTLPVDPFPFNHSTKIAVLRVSRKDERTS
jgi:23S rRNA (cytosine1962-C5)-methyltransferase